MKRLFYAVLALLFTSHIMAAQIRSFHYFETSHFARAMRLGNAYAGVAEGSETMFYNAAGLADINSYSITASSGQGIAFYVKNVDAYDLSAAVPIGRAGALGVSINSLVYSFIGNDDVSYKIYGLSYAHKFFNSLNLGLTANYYLLSMEYELLLGEPSARSVTGSAFDINLSALYKTPVKIFSQDVFQLGFQFKNILNREVKSDDLRINEKLFQNMRAGFSYTLVPELKSVSGFAPVKFMVSFDAVYMGADYTFFEWQPNYGLELTLLDILQMSFGRENEKQLKKTYYYSPQHPVNRYGLGFKLPLKKVFDLNYGLDLKFDYCRSDWQKIDEENNRVPYVQDRIDTQNHAFSLGLNVEL